MPRRSSADLVTLRVDGRPHRLTPPATLRKPAQAVFQQIVGSCQSEHFTKADLPLLERYCETVVLAAQASHNLAREPVLGAKINPWLIVLEKADRALATLALRLRICPQSREHPRSTARHAHGPIASAYESMGGDDDD